MRTIARAKKKLCPVRLRQCRNIQTKKFNSSVNAYGLSCGSSWFVSGQGTATITEAFLLFS